jgi:hypothetical protein
MKINMKPEESNVNPYTCEVSGAKFDRDDFWNKVEDKLPKHHQIVLAYAVTKSGKDGFGVAVFVDSIKMNEVLRNTGYANEAVDVEKYPYYFVSQEQKRHTYNVVTHWMLLPEPPK